MEETELNLVYEIRHSNEKTTFSLFQKWIYEEAEWVVLCVHDNRIPHLEWYTSNESVATHRPKKLVDLLDASYVINVINDERCFAIGFNDPNRPHIELAALSSFVFLFLLLSKTLFLDPIVRIGWKSYRLI